MEGPSKTAAAYLPVSPATPRAPPAASFSLPLSGAKHYSSQVEEPRPSPARTNTHPSWFRQPGPDAFSGPQTRAGDGDHEPAPGTLDDVELGEGADALNKKRRIICGCSQSTFLIFLFFVIVIIAAAIGGGVGSSIFAASSSRHVSAQDAS